MQINEELLRLANLTQGELLEHLANSSTVGGLPFDQERRRAIGKAMFDGWFSKARERLCDRRFKLTGNQNAEGVARDAAAIMDALLAFGDQAPIATLSVLIAKYGLDRLCKDWENPEYNHEQLV